MMLSAEIRQLLVTEIKEQYQRIANQSSVVVYGIKEDNGAVNEVNRIFSLVGVLPWTFSIGRRLGRVKNSCVRPLQVLFNYGIPIPSMKNLYRKLQQNPALAKFRVRLMETQQQRKDGYELRMKRRMENITIRKKPMPPQLKEAVAAPVDSDDDLRMPETTPKSKAVKLFKMPETSTPLTWIECGLTPQKIPNRGPSDSSGLKALFRSLK